MDANSLFAKLNAGLAEERLETFKRNVKKNLPLIKKYGGLREVVPLLRGKRIFIVGAGATLAKDVASLKRNSLGRDAVIIAADMALRPLLMWGVRPDFVISCETKPAYFFHGADTRGIRLLAFSCMSPCNLRAWQGDVSFYNWMLNEPDFNELWQTAGVELGFAATASIVLTQAVSIALGCAPREIVLIGNDLGFRYEFYANGVYAATEYLSLANRLEPLASVYANKTRAVRQYEIRRGDRVFFTTHQFLAAKMWLEKLFKEHSCLVYDCSVPGCSETSVVKANLQDVRLRRQGEGVNPIKSKRRKR